MCVEGCYSRQTTLPGEVTFVCKYIQTSDLSARGSTDISYARGRNLNKTNLLTQSFCTLIFFHSAYPSYLTSHQHHWRPAAERPHCMAPGCGKKFSLVDKRLWCYRCGETVCKRCLAYRRRLDLNAEPKPDGGQRRLIFLSTTQPLTTHLPPLVHRLLLPGVPGLLQGSAAGAGAGCGAQHQEPLRRAAHGSHAPAGCKCTAGGCAPGRGLRAAQALSAQRRRPVVDGECDVCGITLAALFGLLCHLLRPVQQALLLPVCVGVCVSLPSFFYSRAFTLPCSICGLEHCKNCVFRSVEVFLVSPSAAQVDVLHPQNERPNSTALWGCERCLTQLEKASRLQLRLRLSQRGSESESNDEPTPAFKRITEMYETRLAKTRVGAQQTLVAFQDTVELFCANPSAAESTGVGRNTSTSSNNSSSSGSSSSGSSATKGQSGVRCVVKQQTDMAYFHEEITEVSQKVRVGFFGGFMDLSRTTPFAIRCRSC